MNGFLFKQSARDLAYLTFPSDASESDPRRVARSVRINDMISSSLDYDIVLDLDESDRVMGIEIIGL